MKPIFGFICLLLIVSPVYSIGISTFDKEYKVLPGKEYSGELCITNSGQTNPPLNLTNNSGLIDSFSYEPFNFDNQLSRGDPCTKYTFRISDYKHNDSQIIYEKIHSSTVLGEGENVIMEIGVNLKIDASEVSYKNAYLQFSGKLFLTFLSILAVLTVLLYMIRKIRKE